MANLNEVRLMGRLTRDPEQRSTAGGTYIASFGLASSRKYKQDGVQKEETLFIDIVSFGRTAEIVADYAKKGHLIFVGGRLKLDTWQDKNTGQNRQKISVVAENIQLLEKRDTTTSSTMRNDQSFAQSWNPPTNTDRAWGDDDNEDPPF